MSKKDYKELTKTWKAADDFDVIRPDEKEIDNPSTKTITVKGTWKNLKKIVMPENFQ